MTGPLRPPTGWGSHTFRAVWTAVRDVATWGLGAWWGNSLIESPGPGDPTKAVLVAACLGLPFVFRADELRRQQASRSQDTVSSENGTGPAVNRESATP